MSLSGFDKAVLRNDIMSKINRILGRLEQIDTKLTEAIGDNVEQFSNQSMLLNELSIRVQDLEDKK